MTFLKGLYGFDKFRNHAFLQTSYNSRKKTQGEEEGETKRIDVPNHCKISRHLTFGNDPKRTGQIVPRFRATYVMLFAKRYDAFSRS